MNTQTLHINDNLVYMHIGDDSTVENQTAENQIDTDDDAVLIDEKGREILPLNQFLSDFREQLLDQVNKQTPVLFNGPIPEHRQIALSQLKRQPFEAQAKRIAACASALFDHHLPAVFLNGEMGTGKTMMGISLAKLSFDEYSHKPTLVISPPHLVYKWRREILDTIEGAVVHVINGSNAIKLLMDLKDNLQSGSLNDGKPHFIVLGRVRMRMGFYWRPAFLKKKYREFVIRPDTQKKELMEYDSIACPDCGQFQVSDENQPLYYKEDFGRDRRTQCQHCHQPLWSMRHQDDDHKKDDDSDNKVRKFLLKLPGIGKKSADKLLLHFGGKFLTQIIDDNIYDFINLSGDNGDFWFNDKQAAQLEKAMGKLEFALRYISYQPSEFIKRYFPRKCFGMALVDEAHEYKNGNSAQGQAMAVLCNEAEKVVCLTGTLMGGYASDLFYLLFRTLPSKMVEQGYKPVDKQSLASMEMLFMREHGCLIDVIKHHRNESSFKTAKGKKSSVSTKKAPGFSPQGIAQFILPYTVFMRLADLGEGILPEFEEETRMIDMDMQMEASYKSLTKDLQEKLQEAIRHRDFTVTSTVINSLLRWPDTCFRDEVVRHPRHKDDILGSVDHLYEDDELTPKERDLLDLCLNEKAEGRKVIAYTTYTGGHDTSARLKNVLSQHDLNVAVLRSSVKSDDREDWFADQVERGVDVVICNPELVKTGLDLLEFPTLYFMQTGYNVYTIAQASRRSWRIGQKEKVKVYYACYEGTTQRDCIDLMAKKMKTALSTQGVMPETGLEVFAEDESENSIVEALAKKLLSH